MLWAERLPVPIKSTQLFNAIGAVEQALDNPAPH
jgi:hypothetical protein